MRLSIVYDDNGTILAAAEVGPGGDVVLPGAGEHTAEMDVPEQLAEAPPEELLERLQVDVKARQLVDRRD
jgi:hypothetical protein